MTADGKPFFIEANGDTIQMLLQKAGIHGGDKLPPPYVGVSSEGTVWEMFMHKDGKKEGWMVQSTGRSIRREFLHKYLPS